MLLLEALELHELLHLRLLLLHLPQLLLLPRKLRIGLLRRLRDLAMQLRPQAGRPRE